MVHLYTVLSHSTRLPGNRKLVLDVGTIIQFDLTTARDNGLCIVPLTINRQSRRACWSTAKVSEQLKVVLRLSCNALLVLGVAAGTRTLTVVQQTSSGLTVHSPDRSADGAVCTAVLNALMLRYICI